MELKEREENSKEWKFWIGMVAGLVILVILIIVFFRFALKKGVNAFQDTYKKGESQEIGRAHV